ncbi:preprotein translocase subunit YajC [Lapidilactobacillus bayanensis]|uniref:preprotein translocase subunit YajC n=1 Tax=Lapidilactobacillus bayanensis TaxID=2485998 RepID=UPI001CDC4FDB|nr:preprotein translocase subunit YajC [Lapidilactobacillus bayanensis]
MNNLLLAASTASPAGGSFSFLIIIAIMFAVMYFTMIRPGKKQQNQRQTMLEGMKKGDAVVTIGGLHGVIDTINAADGTVVIDADGILLTFNRTAIRDVKPGVGTTPVAPTQEETTVSEEPTVDTHEESADDSDNQ